MAFDKRWVKTPEGSYRFVHDETTLAEILPLKNKNDFNVHIGNDRFKINASGALGQKLEIHSAEGHTVLKIEPEKWYSNVFLVHYHNHVYRLMIRNNPLCEYVIRSGQEELLAYGLDIGKTTNQVVIRITESETRQPILFHLALWYLFEPVARENSADTFWWIYGL